MTFFDNITNAFLELKSKECSIDSEAWTEADTRSKFIDTVLIDCLGWAEADIRRELHNKKRLDYLLSTTRPIMVVEAKKATQEFPIYDSAVPIKIKIATLLKANPIFEKDLEQVAEYCWRFSSPIAVLTNGKTYVIFLAVRTDGIKWTDGEVLIIPNIFRKNFNFSELYNLLSRKNVVEGKLLAKLLFKGERVQPQSVLSTYANPKAIVARNSLGLALEPLLQRVFADVTREDSIEVLQNCYVFPGETSLRAEEFEALLLDKPPQFIDAVLDVSSRNSFEKFQDSIKECLSDRKFARTIFVIGGIGVGKTMFLTRYFRCFRETDTFKRDTCPFFIDFRKPGLDPKQIPQLIFKRLREQLLQFDGKPVPGQNNVKFDFSSVDGLQQVFWPQMQRFFRLQSILAKIDKPAHEKNKVEYLTSVLCNDEDFVRGCFRVLRERYHQHVCVILDNGDQCLPEYQEGIYLFSRTLEEFLECVVIVVLREEWYWYFGKRGGPLSAYHDVVYHIPVPRLRDVLAKRLDYAVQLLEGYRIPTALAQVGNNFCLEAKHLMDYLRIYETAFLNNEDVTVFYECLGNGSIRKGLEVFLSFLRSGHTHVDEYLKALVSKSDYAITFHQVFKPISRGSYEYYSSAFSVIPNVFLPIMRMHDMEISYFARLYLLNHLANKATVATTWGLGFEPLSTTIKFLERLGLSLESSRALIKESVETELLEPDIRMTKEMGAWNCLRITAFGLYMVRVLVGKFAYLESIMLDTPLVDLSVQRRIGGLYLEGVKASLYQRLKCVEDFLAFLKQQESFEQMRVISSGLSGECIEMATHIIELAKADFDTIKGEIKKTPFI